MAEELESSNIKEKLAALRESFAGKLRERIDELNATIIALENEEQRRSSLDLLLNLAHKMAGSAGTFGYFDLSIAARKLESYCVSLINNGGGVTSGQLEKIAVIFEEVKKAVRTGGGGKNDSISGSWRDESEDEAQIVKTIFVVEDDVVQARVLKSLLTNFGFMVETFDNPSSLAKKIESEQPAAIIMDIMFPGNDSAGLIGIHELREKGIINCPVIFLSVRDDFKSRLEAVRSGCDGYVVKPVNIITLVDTLNQLIKRNLTDPYRVLIVEDDEDTAEFYRLALTDTGLMAKVVSRPSLVLEGVVSLRPDVILMDINLPECSGIEMAIIIRQLRDQAAQVPIVFLTSEQGLDQRLETIRTGADDFLSKPVDVDFLIASVTARAERSRAQNFLYTRLKSSEERFRSVAQSANDAIISADEKGMIVFWNDGAEKIFGFPEKEVLGLPIDILISDKCIEDNKRQFDLWRDEFNKQPVEKTIETIGQDKNGNEIPLEISLSDWNSDNRKFFTAIIRDVTARKNYEQELRNIGEKYQSIINTTSEGYWLLDRNLNTIEVNDSLCEMLGYSRDEMIGKKPRDFVDEENAQIFAAQHAAREKVDQRKYEVTLLGKNGEKIYSVFNATSLRDPDGNLAGSFAFVSDISIHKRAEEVLIEAKAHADAANRAKSEFLSSMSHELRTPMNAILGFGQLLDNNPKEPLSESQKDFVAQILKGGEHLLDLINEVLDLAKIEAGRIPLTMESVCIADVIEECMILMQPQAEKLKVSLIDKTRKNDLPNLWVDSTRFKQILLNFMSNAVKYNIPEGTVTLESSPCDDGYLRITVKDTGMGISEFKQMHLFEPFSRLGADQTNIEGTGIGLTITKNLVELMNGRIGFESVSGKGSSFWFEFPISVHDNSADYKKLNNSTDRSEIASQNITEVRKLLYVEDNPENLRLMEGIVNGIPNLSLVSAHTAELGIELAKSDKPDLILMDIHLPGKNGIEALKILQNMDDTKDIPVIALSAAARLEDISRGNEAGFYRYLTKPFKINEVVSTIEDALESSHG